MEVKEEGAVLHASRHNVMCVREGQSDQKK